MSAAAIEIPAGAFVVGAWHFELPDRLSKFGKGGNYLAIMFRAENEKERWIIQYRFRHYRDRDLVWGSRDEFSCWQINAAGEQEKVRTTTDQAIQAAAEIAGEMVDYTSVCGGPELLYRRLTNLPWFHGKEVVTP